MARNRLPLAHFLAERVLMPGQNGEGHVDAIRVIVTAPHFPQRAIMPELIVGPVAAERVTISRDQTRMEGYLHDLPEDGARILVRYGDSLEGELDTLFSHDRILPIRRDCGDIP